MVWSFCMVVNLDVFGLLYGGWELLVFEFCGYFVG